MNLGEIREWFVKDSGRFDLVEPSGANAGADRYINAACRWLDRMTEHHKEIGRVFRTITAGDFLVTFQDCRAILRVGVSDDTTFYGWLDRYTLDELKSKAGYAQPFGSIAQSIPTLYAPAFLRLSDTDAENYAGYESWVNSMSTWRTFNGVILLPPADGDYLVDVWGKFFSETLVNDEDENVWTVTEPQILVKACLRELEVFARNSEGQKDWERAIVSELFGLEKDFVEQEVGDIDQMEG